MDVETGSRPTLNGYGVGARGGAGGGGVGATEGMGMGEVDAVGVLLWMVEAVASGSVSMVRTSSASSESLSDQTERVGMPRVERM